jgi:peptide/nickel transport system permease protein
MTRRSLQRFLRRFFAHRGGAVGLAIMLLVLAVALGAPWLFPGDPLDAVTRPLLPPFDDVRYLLGTDRNGRDIAAGIAHGARVTLAIGMTAAAGAIIAGTVIGALAGFYRGWIDEVLMRFTDAVQTVPGFLLALALVAVLGPSTSSVVTAIALVSWPGTARIVRAEFLSLRERDFVLACRTMGMSDTRLIFGQMLPNVASSIVVLATVVVSIAILVESALSYLGLGDPNVITWGGMIAAGRPVFRTAWTVSAIPGLAIVLTVLGVSLIGEALTNAFNPRGSAR